MKTATKPIIRKSLSITVRKDANGVEEIVLNSGKPDRGGDRVFAKGVDTSDWQKNNVVMWLHDYKGTTPAAGIPLGTGSYIKATDDGLITGPIKWLENDPFVARVRNAWDQRVLKSVSIGFQPPDDNNDMPSNEFGGVDYKKCKLLEYSIVPIPMDADALRIGKDFPELMEKAPKQYSQAQLSDIIDELKCAIANVGLSAENQIELRRLSGSDTPVEIKTIVKSLSDTMDTLEGHHKSHAKCYKDCKDALVQMVDLCNGGKMMPEQSLISKILGK
jgi:hypothetical protein